MPSRAVVGCEALDLPGSGILLGVGKGVLVEAAAVVSSALFNPLISIPEGILLRERTGTREGELGSIFASSAADLGFVVTCVDFGPPCVDTAAVVETGIDFRRGNGVFGVGSFDRSRGALAASTGPLFSAAGVEILAGVATGKELWDIGGRRGCIRGVFVERLWRDSRVVGADEDSDGTAAFTLASMSILSSSSASVA